MQFSRYVNLSFAIAGICAWVVFYKLFALIFEVAGVSDAYLVGQELRVSGVVGIVVAVGLTGFLWRHPQVQTWANEVAAEVSKVTWPTWEETKQHTLVVIVFSIVISAVLASFDFFWKWLTDMILL